MDRLHRNIEDYHDVDLTEDSRMQDLKIKILLDL